VTASPDLPEGNKYTENHRSQRGIGGSYYIIGISAQLSQDTSILGFFWKRGKTPQKIIFEGDSKTTNPVVAKKKKKKKLVVGFIIATPIICCGCAY
jgi:hypothetical protein